MPRRAFVFLPSGRSFSDETVLPSPFLLSFPCCLHGVTVGVNPPVRSRALARCLHVREASLRLKAHNRVGASVEGLHNPGKQKVGKRKTPNLRKRNGKVRQ
jgi:hypothetical protein